jgi:hypothetical protein
MKSATTTLAGIAVSICAATLVPVAAAQTPPPGGLNFYGDFRLRYEDTTKQEPGTRPGILEARHRGVLRFRGGVTKTFGDEVMLNVRLATGAQGDPNTTDVTIGQFVDDFEISLDLVSLEWKHGGAVIAGGKFLNPFLRGYLVWDGDVNPQGLTGTYTFPGSGQATAKVTGIYFIVDEQTTNPDSYMLGGQAQVALKPAAPWTVTLGAAYYDYTLKSLANADAGDTRSNNVAPGGGAYLSDFDLLDVVAIVDYRGFGERYPFKFTGDFVKNRGAVVTEDTAIALDFAVGRASAPKDRRISYGYARTETDAVLAAFSHDDTTFATDYVQHSVALDYVLRPSTLFNVTWYQYRRTGHVTEINDYLTRIRLNVSVSF